MKKANGFTVIELMIVLSLLGLLALIAIPQYQSYTTRAKATESIGLSTKIKNAIAERFAATGQLASNNQEAGIDELVVDGAFTSSITVQENGKIQITLTSSSSPTELIVLTPSVTGPTLSWQCSTTLKPAEAPTGCTQQ